MKWAQIYLILIFTTFGYNNPKLESFVYKRVHYKMDKLEYNIESEDISDISFSVKYNLWLFYGLWIKYNFW